MHAVPRQEAACVVCCIKDWVEHRYTVLLFKEPNGQTCWSKVLGTKQEALPQSPGTSPDTTLCAKDGHLCLGPAEAIDELLNIKKYQEIMPQIPLCELEASSVAHPADHSMKWMLHLRRVPVQDQRAGLARIGCADKVSFMCADCVNALCKRRRRCRVCEDLACSDLLLPKPPSTLNPIREL